MTQLFLPDGSPLSLGQGDFLAQGGEGKVFVKGRRAFKVAHDPATAIAPGRLAALQKLDHPQILKPEGLLTNSAGVVVGHYMRRLESAWPLSRLSTGTFCKRHGITDAQRLGLAEQLRQLVSFVHQQGALIVDLNPFNVLVDAAFERVYLIDVDSYQIGRWLATAVMDTVRDHHATAFDQGTDWFSFAVVSFELIAGMHPFRGKHSQLKGIAARMTGDISVFDRLVKVPTGLLRLNALPKTLKRWHQRVFSSSRCRGAPPPIAGLPTGARGMLAVDWTAKAIERTRWLELPEIIQAFAESAGRSIAICAGGVYVDGRRVAPRPRGEVATAFVGARPIVLSAHGGVGSLLDADTGRAYPVTSACETVMASGGRLFAKARGQIVQLGLRSGVVVCTAVARVHPLASTLYPGLVIQRALGGLWLGLFLSESGTAGGCVLLKVPGLEGARIVEARGEGSVALLRIERGGRALRLTVRLSDRLRPAALQVETEPDDGTPLALARLPSGVFVRTGPSGLRLFTVGGAGARDLGTDGAHFEGLIALDGGLGLVSGAQIWSLAVAQTAAVR